MSDLGEFKNTLPSETDDRADLETPRQLHTQAAGRAPLSRAEADVAGITAPVYGDDDIEPNAGDE